MTGPWTAHPTFLCFDFQNIEFISFSIHFCIFDSDVIILRVQKTFREKILGEFLEDNQLAGAAAIAECISGANIEQKFERNNQFQYWRDFLIG